MNSHRVIALLTLAALGTTGVRADYEPPRTAGGKPDFTGVWQVLNTANHNLEAHTGRAAQIMREGPVVPVPASEVVALGAVGALPPSLGVVEGDEIPYREDALAQREENRRNWMTADPEVRCYLPGIPRATYLPHPFRIVHNDDTLLFSYSYAGAVRNVRMEDPGPAPIDSWMGQSWARWEGDTLVIETSGFNGRTWFDRAGNYHSDKLVVTERFERTSDHTIEYTATMEDPAVFTRPWTIRMPLYRRVGRDANMLQFNCVEYVEELMYGHLRKEPLD
ncbi:MAG: hypothetical protein U5K56_16755 [Halioglobus sp.]|nr:hypothetical protein [Halioglobus sp.]